MDAMLHDDIFKLIFIYMEVVVFCFDFDQNLLPWAQLTIKQHWYGLSQRYQDQNDSMGKFISYLFHIQKQPMNNIERMI